MHSCNAKIMPYSCLICQNQTVTCHDNVFDDRYGYPELFSIAHCKQCGTFFTYPRLTESQVGRLYSDYYPPKKAGPGEQAAPVKKATWGLKQKIKLYIGGNHKIQFLLPSDNKKILDIGCGDGQSLSYLNSIGYQASGVEANVPLAESAKAKGLDVIPGTIESSPLPKAEFDIIIANQLVEHVTDLTAFFKNVRQTLKADGRLILSTPNGNGLYRKLFGRNWINWHIPYHQQIFTKKSIRLIAKQHGWNIEIIKSVTPNQWTLHQFCTLSDRPKIGEKSSHWTGGQKAINRLYKIPIIIVNRLIDLLGQGDCLLIFLKTK